MTDIASLQTGTLTHEGLELCAVIPSAQTKFQEPVTNVAALETTKPLVQAMATCHSLTRIDGKLSGDPLDLNMFESINWVNIFARIHMNPFAMLVLIRSWRNLETRKSSSTTCLVRQSSSLGENM